jgi:PRTRC genetic system protein B
MQAQVHISSTQNFELRNALLIYECAASAHSHHPSTFVTNHPVLAAPDGPPSLGPGQPIGKEDISALLVKLRGSIPIEFLPANVLVRTDDTIVWWTPASIRPMFYAEEKSPELKQLSGKRFPQPALVFRVAGNQLDMRALASNERPTRETPVYRVPYWNVNDEGNVCLGSTRVPQDATVDNLSVWEHAFFESRFTHSNCFRSKLTEHPNGFVGLWRSLIGKKTFPREYLAAADQTLAEFIKGK